MFGFGQGKKVTEKLYAQNLELAVKNKTLSLLENLYQTSVLSLMPEDMAQKITNIIRDDLNLELASILIFEQKSDTLLPLAFSASDRLLKIIAVSGFDFKKARVANVLKNDFFSKAVYEKLENSTDSPTEILKEFVSGEYLPKTQKEAHIKTILLYPLIKGNEVSGVLLLGLNRSFGTLNTFERASIKSCINAIALLLDKAYLYKDLQAAYEVEKEAKEEINKAYELEKKTKQELEKLDKVKDQFLMTTQHNLRAPLTSIMGYSDLILNGMYGKQNKKTIEVVEKLEMLGKGMIKMINDFLDAAQFQLGKDSVQLKPGVDLLPIISETVNELKFKAEQNGVLMTTESPATPCFIRADREKLKAAIFNVIDNSIKYTPKGKIGIRLEEKGSVKIIVSDTGIGISPENINTLFVKMFERGSNVKNITGTGVGLYLSAQIIKSHGGKIWAESPGEGKGSTFYIDLPLDSPK